MSKTRMIKARTEPDLRRRLEELARERGYTRAGQPNLSKALREVAWIGLGVIDNEGEGCYSARPT